MSEIVMPRLSDTMEEGTLSQWLKKIGDTVAKGDVLAEIETDKATMELEAFDEGVLAQILVEEGQAVPIGTPLAILSSGDDTVEAPARPRPSEPTPTPPATQLPASPAPAVRAADDHVKASPVARAMAREFGVDLQTITGGGPGGRVVRADVEAARSVGSTPDASATLTAPSRKDSPADARRAAVAATGDDDEEIPLTNLRKVTARRLVTSMQEAPHFYLTTVIDAEELVVFREDLNARIAKTGIKVSVNDLIVKACATALRAHPGVNASWAGDKILRHRRVHVGLAVALDTGLIVPVVRDADTKSLTHIAVEARGLAEKARAGKLTPDEFTGGTFTVSNLGMYGIDHFTAVINPPEAAILAVGATKPEPVASGGAVVVRHTLRLTLSIDHRVLDGAAGARFLASVKELLEEPLRIVV
jgi:pyruvate dehydrogenase E2 component (dihydrolipoamide acetyltransferase)